MKNQTDKSADVFKDCDLYRGTIYSPLPGQVLKPGEKPKYIHFHDGALLVNRETGLIVDVRDFDKLPQLALKNAQAFGLRVMRVIDCRPHWILPGFVDTHVHLPQILMAGRSGLPLLEWLQRYTFRTEKKFSDDVLARATARHFFERLAAAGTTTAAVYPTLHQSATRIAFEEAQRAGLRISMGQVLMDQNGGAGYVQRNWRAAMRESEELIRQWHGANDGLIRYLLTPRFAIACSRPLLEACGQMAADFNIGVQTHLNEERGEIVATKKIHKWAKNYTDVYVRTGVVSEDRLSILAHQVHVGEAELKKLNRRHVCIAHCPGSNFALRSGTPAGGQFDFWKVYGGGKRLVGLGSDVGGGRNLSMLEAMRYGGDIQTNQLSVFQLWHLATTGGAEALRLNTGALRKNYEADFIVVDPEQLNPSRTNEGGILRPLEDLQDHLLVMMSFGTTLAPSFVRRTFVKGREVYTCKTRN